MLATPEVASITRRENLEGRGLARAIRTDEAENLARVD